MDFLSATASSNSRSKRGQKRKSRVPLQEISNCPRDRGSPEICELISVKKNTTSSAKEKNQPGTSVQGSQCSHQPPRLKNQIPELRFSHNRDAEFFQSPLVIGGHNLRSSEASGNIYRRSPSTSPDMLPRVPGDDRTVCDAEVPGVALRLSASSPESGEGGPSKRLATKACESSLEPDELQAAILHWKERALTAEQHLKELASPLRPKKPSPTKDEVFWNRKYEELISEKENLEKNLEKSMKQIEYLKKKKNSTKKQFLQMVSEREGEWTQKYLHLLSTKNSLAKICKEMQGTWEERYHDIQEKLMGVTGGGSSLGRDFLQDDTL